MTTVLETCQVPPPPGAADELEVPLSFFDIKWLHFHPIRRLLFYDHPCSNAEFLDTIVPKLKRSLSLTLKHYLPVAGNLLYPADTEKKPLLCYVAGDSVSLTVAESSNDFDELVGNHARDADQFYDFMPQMPPVRDDPEYKIVPLMALQVTLFPGRGICLGSSNLHSLGDARSTVGFIWAWASVNKDDGILSRQSESLPFFDRTVIKDPLGIDTIFWKVLRNIPFKPASFPLPTNRVRATFILTQSDIKKLKDLALNKKPSLIRVSSLVVAASYVWSCVVKSNEKVQDDSLSELFVLPADARGRTNPPVPENYFGNCIVGGVVIMEHKKVAGEEGFPNAVEAISEEIKNRLNSKDEILKGAENWLSDIWKCMGMNALGISGSPKFDLSEADFGWGKARKVEVLSIDGEKYSMSLSNSRDEDGGLEVGLSLPKERMDAFAAIFAHGLRL